jgi:hypothetical protein
MKKTILTVALMAMTTVASFAQGSIAPLNASTSRVKIDVNRNGVVDAEDRNAFISDGIVVSVFFGPAGSATADTKLGEMTIGDVTPTGGVMVGLPALLQVPGYLPGATISLQFRVTSPQWTGQTTVKQVVLGQESSAAAIVWAGTATASRFSSLLVTPVPEPSTIALGVLGLGSLLLFRRRK